MDDWTTIRTLKNHNPDLSNREIGRLLGGVSHNTVKKALSTEDAPSYKRPEVCNDELTKFKDYIEKRLIKDNLQGSRILRELESKGYKGSKSAFYRYLSKLQHTRVRTFQPYETVPGEQAQFDWSPYTITINGELTQVYVFNYILGYSRHRIYESSLSQTLGSVFEALENSIIEIGGVCQRVQTDNAACFVINASRDNFKWNPRYLNLCGHYGFQPSRSLPKHPWSKGKVERPFDYLEEQFIKGNAFDSYEDFYSQLKIFQEEVNSKVHHTTKRKPKEMYIEELTKLAPLPDMRFVDIKEEVRKVTSDCLVAFQGNRYSVPHFFAAKEVWLKVSQGSRLLIYSSQNKLIAEHDLSFQKGGVFTKLEHYKNHENDYGNWERLSKTFLDIFPDLKWFLEKLKAQKRINPRYHLKQIVELSKYYEKADLRKAFEVCDNYNIYSYTFISAYLQNHSKVEVIPPSPIDSKVLQKINSISIKRDLNEYKFSDLQLSNKSNYEENK